MSATPDRESADSNRPARVGVDVGGTNIRAGLIASDGTVLTRRRLRTPVGSPSELADSIAQAVWHAAGEYYPDAVGVAVGGRVDNKGRRVLQAANIGLTAVPLADLLDQRLGSPCVILNDANAALIAEHRYGAAWSVEDAVLVTVGTGVGGSAMVGGRLVAGAHGGAGEAGHMTVRYGGRRCACGGRGCLDQYGSGSALWRYARARYRSAGLDLPLRLDVAARSGDPHAIAAFSDLAHWLAQGIADLVALFDPGLVVLGGGVATAGKVLTAPVEAALRCELDRRSVPWCPRVTSATLGDDGGMIGAAVAATEAALDREVGS